MNFMFLFFTSDSSEGCKKIGVPYSRVRDALLFVEGVIGGSNFSHSGKISIQNDVADTYVSTDKYLYKPGQTVKFRILTIEGPFMKISTYSVS